MPIDEEADLQEIYDEKLFELKQFFLNRFPMSKLINARLAKFLKEEKAFTVLGGEGDDDEFSFGNADLPEFTSIQERIKAFADAKKASEQVICDSNEKVPNNTVFQPRSLLPFTADNDANGIHFSLIDYLALADSTGRCVHPRKKGYIDADQLGVLKSLNIDENEWLESVQNFEGKFVGFAGKASMLYFHANQNGQLFHSGVG